jgi:hypothetical protein
MHSHAKGRIIPPSGVELLYIDRQMFGLVAVSAIAAGALLSRGFTPNENVTKVTPFGGLLLCADADRTSSIRHSSRSAAAGHG